MGGPGAPGRKRVEINKMQKKTDADVLLRPTPKKPSPSLTARIRLPQHPQGPPGTKPASSILHCL